MRQLLQSIILFLSASAMAADRPNILWLTFEDSSPHLGCYGDKNANTPNLDALAARGLRYKMAWSNAPVCAPARTCIISGRWAPADGAEHMRSEVPLPTGHKMYPQFLKEAGYYCTNNVKEDYNLTKPSDLWDESSGKAHWRNRPAGQPFFAIFNYGNTHESQIRARPHTLIHDPAKVGLPPYHPDTPEVRHDWAQHFDNLTTVDGLIGRALAEVKAAGLAEDTIIFSYADHGTGMPRSKRWPYNSGLRVPFIVHFPEKWKHLAPKDYQPGGESARLISFIDLSPTLVSIVGQQPPAYLQGRAFAGAHAADPPKHIFGFRGRMDERYDMMRSATDGRYVYVRHFYPHLPAAQHVNYMFLQATTQVWHDQFLEGKLNDTQAYVWKPKASEELYDLQSDPHEVQNLAANPEHKAKLDDMRQALTAWLVTSRDLGFMPEAQRLHDADGKSPKDTYADAERYPAADLIQAALKATDRSESDASALLTHAHAGIRFWGAQGALLRGADAVKTQGASLQKLLQDPSRSVRTAAAESLALHGDDAQKAAAWATLLENADPTKQSTICAAEALNAIDHQGPDALTANKEALAKLPINGQAKDPGRTKEYALRLHEYLGGLLGYDVAKGDGKKEKKKGKKK
jgi:uncharacterized sulfatase